MEGDSPSPETQSKPAASSAVQNGESVQTEPKDRGDSLAGRALSLAERLVSRWPQRTRTLAACSLFGLLFVYAVRLSSSDMQSSPRPEPTRQEMARQGTSLSIGTAATPSSAGVTPAQIATAAPVLTATAAPQPAATITTTNTVPPPAYSSPVRIRIPSINLDADVVEVEYNPNEASEGMATLWDVADWAAGFHLGSAYPGHRGNTVIAGHNNIRGRVFRHLLDLLPGDDIYLYADGQEYHYQVTQRLLLKEQGMPPDVQRENAEWIEPTLDERLTLVSCWPFIRPDHRVVVVARPAYW
jgi:LPXTG-site transpeptidase (sortase) family protein